MNRQCQSLWFVHSISKIRSTSSTSLKIAEKTSSKNSPANKCSKNNSSIGYQQLHPVILPNVCSSLNSDLIRIPIQNSILRSCTAEAERQHGNNKAIACMPASLREISGGSGSHGRTCKAQHYDIS